MGTKERCCLEAVFWRPGDALGDAVHLSHHTREGAGLSPRPHTCEERPFHWAATHQVQVECDHRF